MTEIIHDGTRLIPSRDASRRFSITNDYIGRLCKQEKVVGRLISGSWYVNEDSLRDFLLKVNREKYERRENLREQRAHAYREAQSRLLGETISARKIVLAEKNSEPVPPRPLLIHATPRRIPKAMTAFANRGLAVMFAVMIVVGGLRFSDASVFQVARELLPAAAVAGRYDLSARGANSALADLLGFGASDDSYWMWYETSGAIQDTPTFSGDVAEKPSLIGRVVDAITPASVSGISEALLNTRLAALETRLMGLIALVPPTNSVAPAYHYYIDNSSGVGGGGFDDIDITNSTYTGGTITNATITGGSVTATAFSGVVPVVNGGTGTSTYATGDILYADSSATLGRLAQGTNGQVLKVVGGTLSWSTDNSGGGGSGAFATTSDNLAIYVSDPTDVVILGATATSTTGNILEVLGNSLLRGTLTAYNTITAPIFTATSSAATSTMPRLNVTGSLGIGSDYITDISGTGLSVQSGALTLNATGDWTGTFDGQEGNYYLANSFSTTSANYFLTQNQEEAFSTTSASYFLSQNQSAAFATTSADFWQTQRNFFSTTSSEYWKSVNNFFSTTSADFWKTSNNFFSTTSANYFVDASTTIPKTYSANSFTALQTFTNASSTLFSSVYASTTNLRAGSFTLGTLNGPLQANNGVVSATTSIGVLYGGTGLTTAPSYGQVLLGNAAGGYDLVATSSLGIAGGGSSFAYPFPNDATSTTLTFTSGLVSVGSTTINGNATTTGMQSVGSLFINGERFTDLTGSGLLNSSGALTLDATGNWTGTFDGQEGSYYLANSFSTSSATYFASIGLAFSTTSADAWKDQRNFFSTTSAQYFVHSSTTIPKTYTANTFTALQSFANASSTLFSSSYASTTALFANTASTSNLTISALQNGLLKVDASGVVSLATAGTDYANFAYPFPAGATSTLVAFNGGLTSHASTTIGNGTATGGLTVSGGATTTGTAFFSGNIGVGTSTPFAKLGVQATSGQTNPLFEISSSSIATKYLSVSAIGFGTTTLSGLNINGSATSTSNVGFNLTSGCFSMNGLCIVSSNTGDWTGTFDGQEGSYYLANSFSTTSAIYFVDASTTIPKTYSANSFTALQTFTNASSTLFSSSYASSTRLFAGAFTLGSLNGPLHANNGVVSATSSILAIYGGTGQTNYAVGDILYADSVGSLTRLAAGGSGTVLKISGGVPTWGTDLTSGGGGGAGAWATTSDSLAVYPTDTSDVIIIGASATTTTNSILEVFGRSYFSNNVGIGTTSAGARLAVEGSSLLGNSAVAGFFVATTTSASTFPYASTTMMTATTASSTSLYISGTPGVILKTNANGQVAAAVAGTDYIANTTGDWTGTFDGQEGSYYLANSFSTTSSDYWKTQRDFFSTTSAIYFAHSSTTIPKTYTANVFTALQTFTNASSTLFSTTYASTTNLVISGLQSGLLKVDATGNVSLAVAGTDYSNFAYPFPSGATSTLVAFNGGLTAYASSTIGNGTQTGGLTVSGGATTTGTAYFSGNVGIGTSTPFAKLGVQAASGQTNPLFEVSSSSIATKYLSVSAIGFGTTTLSGLNINGSATSTSNVGMNITSGCFSINGLCVVSSTGGDWTGTFDGQEGSYYLANSFSTTSADFWKTERNFFSTTSSDYWKTQNNFFSTTSAIYFVDASTTIPKTYSSNTFTNTNVFSGALTANSAFTLGTLNGPLQANNGLVSATTSIGVLYGGTGLTSAPTYGQLLMGNSSSGYTLVATSSLGLGTISSIGPAGQQSTGPSVTFATSTGSFNGLTAGITIVGSGNTQTFTPSLSGTLNVSGGGTGATSFTSGSLVYGSGTGALQSIATTTATIGGSLSYSGTFGALVGGASGTLSLNMGNANTWTALQTFANASSTLFSSGYASTTNLFAGTATIGNLNGLLKATNGLVAAAVLGTDYQNFAYPFGLTGNATSTLTQFNGGLTAYASSTIGAGSQTTGLTISGGATTTGNAYFAGNVAIGTTTASTQLTVGTSANSSTGINILNSDTGTAAQTTLLLGSKNTGSTYGFLSYYGSGYTPNGARQPRATLLSGHDTGGLSLAAGNASGDIKFFTGGITDASERMRITSSGNIGIGTSTPYAKLTAWGDASGNIFEAVTGASSSALSVSATGFGTTTLSGLNISGSATSTSNVGFNVTGGCFAVNGTCLLSSTAGDWTGTFDGQEGSYYLANSFSTTSANYWQTTRDFFSTTSAIYFAHSSTTIPKTYTANTFTALQTFSNASSTLFSASYASTTALFANTASTSNLTISALQNGLLKVNASGVVSLAIAGTDYANFAYPFPAGATTTALSFGNITATNATTSTLFSSILSGNIASFGQTATSSFASNGALTLATALTVPNGGTGVTSFTSGSLVYGSGTGALQSVATTTATIGGSLSYSGTFGALVGGSSGTLSLNMANANIWTALQQFAGASTTVASAYNAFYVGRTSTTTIRGDNQASTLPYASTTAITATTASTTNLIISGLNNGLLKVDASGIVSLASAGTDYQNFAYPFGLTGNATSSLTQFNGGLTAYASSTIGSGTQAGGLTVSGGATTTGYLKVLSTATSSFAGPLAITSSGTSTFANGIQLSAGCFRDMNGTCIVNPDLSAYVDGAGSGSTNRVAYWSDSNTLTSDADFSFDGTTVTARDLLVQHTAPILSLNDSDTSGTDFRLDVADGSATFNADIAASLSNEFFAWATNNSEVMRLTEGGRLGIGTSTPFAKLSVQASAGQSNPIFEVASSSNATKFLSVSGTGFGTTTLSGLDILGSATSTSNVGFNLTAGCYAVNSTCISSNGSSFAYPFPAGATSSPLMLLASTTIGAGTQTTGLTVSGGATTTGNAYIAGTLRTVGNATIGGDLTVSGSSVNLPNGNVSLTSTGGQNIATFDASSINLGAGAVGDFTLYITPTNNQVNYSTLTGGLAGASPSLTLNGSDTNVGFNIMPKGSGNVGIGTSSPYAKLAVWGGSAGKIFEVVTSASSSALSVSATGFGTTTLSGLNISGSATSTSNVGFNLTAGCYAIGGTCLSTGGSSFAYPFPAGATSSPLMLLASTTIGDGTQAGGLTISGGATTTLNAYFAGNIGLGTTSPGAKLSVEGFSLLGNRAVSGFFVATTSSASTFPYASTTALTSSGSAYFATSGGNVGIGTTTPQWLLNPTSASAAQLALSAGAGLNQWAFRNAGGDLFFATTTVAGTATTSTSALTISGSGFGTTTLRGLNISGQATSTSNVGFNITAGCYAVNGTCLTSPFTFATNFGSTMNAATTSVLWAQNGLNASSTVRFGNAGLSNFLFDSSTGRLGLGSTTPWAQLSINPNGITGPAFVIGSSTATNFIVTNGGNVGIGTSSPSGLLSILASSTFSNSLFEIRQQTASTSANGSLIRSFTVASTSNIGIRTAFPTQALEVAGTIKAHNDGIFGELTVNSDGIFRGSPEYALYGFGNRATSTVTGQANAYALSLRSGSGSATSTGFTFDTSISGGTNPQGSTFYDGFFWLVDITDAEVYKYAPDGTYTGVHFDTGGSGAVNPAGIVAYNNFFWVTDNSSDKVYQYTTNGTYTGFNFDTAIAGSDIPLGITSYGGFLWVTDQTDAKVNKFTVEGTYTGFNFDTTGSGSDAPRGIVFYNNFFWILDLTDAEVYQYTTSGVYTGVHFDTAESGNTSPTGLTVFNGFFWVTDSSGDEVYQYTIPSTGGAVEFSTDGSIRAKITSAGNFGVGTSTPFHTLTVASTTGPQFALSAGAGLNQWAFRNAGGDLFFSTTTVAGTATTSTSALTISGSGFGTTTLRGLNISGQATSTSNVGFNLTGGCYAINGTCLTAGGSSFAYPFPAGATSSSLMLLASTTIGAGAQATGLTISGGATTTLNAYIAGSLGIATTSPGARLSVEGSSLLGNFAYAGYYIATTTLASQFPYASSTALTSSGSAYLATTGGSVGIGTTTPFHTLTVASTTGPQLSLSAGAGLSQWVFRNAGGDLYFATTSVAGTATSSRAALMFSNSNGYLGIGTTSPLSPVHINSTLSPDDAPEQPGNYNLYLTSPSGTGFSTGIGFGVGSATTNVGAAIIHARTGLFGNGELQFYTNSSGTAGGAPTQRMVINSVGDIGIGTSTPQWVLNPYSATEPQLALSAGAGFAQWGFRNANGNLFFSTTTVEGTATTSSSALTISGSGFGTTTLRGLNINGEATTTSNVGLRITSSSQGLSLAGLTSCTEALETDSNGYIICGSDATGVGGGAYPFPGSGNSTSTLTQFNGGLTAYASSTIGDGTAGGGLTVNGGANMKGLVSIFTTGADPSIYNPSAGNGLILRGDLNGAQLRIVSNPNAWTGGATSTSYFQITNAENGNVSFMGGTWGADRIMNRLQFNASSTQFTDLSYEDTPIPESILEAISSTARKIGLKVRGATAQTAEFFSVQDVSGNRLLNVASSGNVGVGTTTPATLLEVHRAAAASSVDFDNKMLRLTQAILTANKIYSRAALYDGGIYGADIGLSYNAGPYAMHFSVNDNTSGDPSTIMSLLGTGNVGIGTTTPFAKLSVHSTAGIPQFVIGSSTATQFVVDQLGRVGVGTAAPSSKFHVSDSSNTYTFRFDQNDASGQGFYGFVNSDTTNDAFRFDNSVENIFKLWTNGNLGLSTSSPWGLLAVNPNGITGPSFVVGSSTKTDFIVTNSGNVGIGTAAPAAPLTVFGDTFLDSAGTTDRMLYFRNQSSLATIQSDAALRFNSGNTERLRILSGGDIGIATTTAAWNLTSFSATEPQLMLSAGAGFAQWGFRNASGNLFFSTTTVAGTATSTLPAFLINGTTGRVGIATTTPSALFAINANAVTSAHVFMIGSSTRNLFSVSNGGLVGIGTTTVASTTKLIVDNGGAAGTIAAAFGGTGGMCFARVGTGYTCNSDFRLKKDIQMIEPTLSKLMKLRPTVYNWKTEDSTTTPQHAGFIAQEVREVFPDLVGEDMYGYLDLNYAGLTPILTSALQELNLRLETIASTTATSTPDTQIFASHFFSNVFTRITKWFADAANGIGEFFVGRIHTKEICVGENGTETCITKAQLDALLAGSGVPYTQQPTPPVEPEPEPEPEEESVSEPEEPAGESASSTPSVAETPESESETPTPQPAPTPTPEPTPETTPAPAAEPPATVSDAPAAEEDAS